MWMGTGEAWLVRALTFGRKILTGYLCNPWLLTTSAILWFDRDHIAVFKNFFDIALRVQQLELGRKDIWTRTLQKYLVKLGYLSSRYRNGSYDVHTQTAVCNYQLRTHIVSRSNPDCGTFGPLTRYAMKLDMIARNFLPADLYEETTLDTLIASALAPFAQSTTSITATPVVIAPSTAFQFYRPYKKNEQSSEVRKLQQFLLDQGLFSGMISGIYSQKTIDALYDFQKKYNLISDKDALSLRGYLGPKTRGVINSMMK